MDTFNRKQFFYSSGIYGIFLFTFLLSESLINDRAAVVLGSNMVNFIYSCGLVCTASGYLLYPFFRKHMPNNRIISVVLLTVCFISVICMIFAESPALFIVSAFLSLILLGICGGSIHFGCAISLRGSHWLGRIIGTGIAFSVVIQFVVQELLSGTIPVLCVSIALGYVSMAIFAVVRQPIFFETTSQHASVAGVAKRALILSIATVALMSLVLGLNDGIMTMLNANGTVKLYSYPRLVYGISVLLAGFIADKAKRRFLAFSTGCTMLLYLIVFICLNDPALYLVNISVFYLFSGFYVVYFTVEFLDIAPSTSNPALFAGMGRISRSLSIAVIAVPAPLLYASLGPLPILAFCLMGVIGVFVLFFVSNKLVFSEDLESSPDNSKVTEWQKRYSLTPRETDVLAKVLKSDRSVAELAGELFISERVMYRYLTSIYEKTNTKSRIGLVIKFHDDKDPV